MISRAYRHRWVRASLLQTVHLYNNALAYYEQSRGYIQYGSWPKHVLCCGWLYITSRPIFLGRCGPLFMHYLIFMACTGAAVTNLWCTPIEKHLPYATAHVAITQNGIPAAAINSLPLLDITCTSMTSHHRLVVDIEAKPTYSFSDALHLELITHARMCKGFKQSFLSVYLSSLSSETFNSAHLLD